MDARAKFALCLRIPERFSAEVKSGPGFKIRADSRRFRDREVSRQPLLCREIESLGPPIFQKSFPVW